MSAARTTYETLLVELDRSVALITLNRPDRLNAFDQQMTRELFDELGAFDADESVRAVVVTGAARAFSAGADLDGGFGEQTHDAEASAGAPPRPLALDFRPWEMRTPILAAINGAAVGVGLTYSGNEAAEFGCRQPGGSRRRGRRHHAGARRRHRDQHIADGCANLWTYAEKMLQDIVDAGHLPKTPRIKPE